MTENPKYGLRLTDRFFFYDPEHGAHVSRSWAKDSIETDQEAIALLEQHNAPIERIEVPADPRQFKR